MNNVTEELIARAAQHRRERKPTDAAREWAEAVELSLQQNDIPNLIRSLRGAAETERDLVRNCEAGDLYEEAVSLCRKQNNDVLLLAHAVRHLGDVDAISGSMRAPDPATKKHSESIAESRRRILWMWPTHCDRLQFLKKRWEIRTAHEHSGARLANSTDHSLLMLALRKLRRLSPDSAGMRPNR